MATAAVAIPPPPPGFEIEPTSSAPAAAAGVALPPGFELEHPYDKIPPAVLKRAITYSPAADETAIQAIGTNRASTLANIRETPLIGSSLPKATAYLNALAAKMGIDPGAGMSKTGTISEMAAANEPVLIKGADAYHRQHPIETAIGGMAAGTGLLAPVGAIGLGAKALGMTGALRTAVPLGSATGAAIGAGDAITRGEDPLTGGVVGGLTGAVGVLGGKALGKGYDAVRGALRPTSVAPVRTVDVNGVRIPTRASTVEPDQAAARVLSQEEETVRTGGRGARAQAEAVAADEANTAGFKQAHDEMAASLDPTGTRPAATPQAAGEAISSEVSAQEATRAAAEAQRLQAVGTEGQAIRTDLNTSATPGVLADTPRTAAAHISESLQGARDVAAGARDRAYETLRTTPGEYSPAVFQRTGARIRESLNHGNDPVRVDSTTPQTARMIDDIEMNVGQRRFENQAEPPLQMGPDGRPIERPITLDTIDSARKRLISMARAANDTARSTGNYTDVRGARRVLNAFDEHVAAATRVPGGFSGDAEAALRNLTRARQLHTELKSTFGPQNQQDVAGKAIEKIVGKRSVAPAEHEDVAPLLFGSPFEAGGGKQHQIAQRIIDLFGADSPQVASLKQGLISHLVDTPAGIEPLSHAQAADRIHKFFSGTKGVGLAQTVFSPSERARLLAHANRMRTASDPAPQGFVEKTVAKWAGRDGGLRASPKIIVDDLVGSTGQKGTSPALVDHLKQRLSPEAMGTLKQGVWSRITEGAEGTIPWKDQKVGQRIMNFLNGDGKGLADALFTKAERDAMRNIASAHIKNLPIEGTKPVGSGPVIQRLTHGAVHSILPFAGFHMGGLPGVAAAYGAKKAVGSVIDRRAAAAARELFNGPQPKRSESKLPQRFGALGGYLAAGQSR